MYNQDSQAKHLLTALAAFAGGVVAGMLLAPQSGKDLRRNIGENVNVSTRKVSEQLQDIEQQLHRIETMLHDTSDRVARVVRDAAGRVVEHYGPGIPPTAADWDLDDTLVTHDLSRMPQR